MVSHTWDTGTGLALSGIGYGIRNFYITTWYLPPESDFLDTDRFDPGDTRST